MRVRTGLFVAGLSLSSALAATLHGTTAFALIPPATSVSPSAQPPFGRPLRLGPDGKPLPAPHPTSTHPLPLREIQPEGSPSQSRGSTKTTEEDEDRHGPAGMNWTDFSNKDQPPYLANLINFAILLFLYVYFGKKPIAVALAARREAVAKQIEEAQKIKHEAEARSKQYAAKLEDLGVELETTKVALASAGAGEKARLIREAQEKAERMEKEAVLLLEQERRQVQQDLAREALSRAVAEAEHILRSKLTQADQERLADEFLATLAPASGAAATGEVAS